jgi:alpha-D-ribose 1-methylphosphonate 5-triphosphate synthase subunit PhnH
MTATPTPDAFEARTNATFEALMWALSRPGTVQPLPASGMAGLAETLVDRECRVYCEDAALAPVIASFGAALVPASEADHCFLTGTDALPRVATGSALYPDAGATVVMQASFGQGQRLRLTGPGIETHTDIALSGMPGIWALRAARCRYPAGFDLFLICGATVMGLPRSTQIEVL